MRKIIIPAAGKSVRFGGVYKDQLIIDHKGKTCLEYCIEFARDKLHADEIVLITSAEKHALHYKTVLKYQNELVIYLVTQTDYSKDLLSAIQLGLTVGSDVDSGLLMADTIPVLDEPIPDLTAPMSFGIFATRQPARFTILHEGTLLTKPTDLPDGVYNAWGIVLWRDSVNNFLLNESYDLDTYDDMFRSAMDFYTTETFNLVNYHDIGTPEAYISQFLITYGSSANDTDL